jgi:hypothetical protein
MIDPIADVDSLHHIVYDTIQVTIVDTLQAVRVLDRITVNTTQTVFSLTWWGIIAQLVIAIAAVVGIGISYRKLRRLEGDIAEINDAADLRPAIEAMGKGWGDEPLSWTWKLRISNFGRSTAKDVAVLINGEPLQNHQKIDFIPDPKQLFPTYDPFESHSYNLINVNVGDLIDVDVSWADGTNKKRNTRRSLLVYDPEKGNP